MSKQFEVHSWSVHVSLVEAVHASALSDGELFCYDKEEKIAHQFHSWTGVRTLAPAAGRAGSEQAVENVCRADAEAMERQASNESEAYRKGYKHPHELRNARKAGRATRLGRCGQCGEGSKREQGMS